jgi:hypothetical protein
MKQCVAGNVLETQSPQRHIISCVGAVRSLCEGWPRVPDAAHKNSLSIPVIRPRASLFEGLAGRSEKDVIS